MRSRYSRFKNWLKSQLQRITPGTQATKGALLFLLVASITIYVVTSGISFVAMGSDPTLILLIIAIFLLVLLIAYVGYWLLTKILKIPKKVIITLSICLPLLIVSFSDETPIVFGFLCCFVLLGAAIFTLTKTGFKNLTVIKKVMAVAGLLIGISLLVAGSVGYFKRGVAVPEVINAANLNDKKTPLSLPSPATIGNFKVQKLTYGSGNDKHRDAFGTDVTLITDPVNGVAFLDHWEGLSGWYREQYWGFDDTELPLNGYVWYPEGEGPFPLVLIVHGNHIYQDYSDTGYAYLGELLASRGYIVASVDQNFINGSWADIAGGLDDENDARGWLLLEHLRQWQDWNADPESPFYEKVDTCNLGLIGHSRGGEAVAHASFLNTLSQYPDDATISLNYNYEIKAIAAIAPVDGQYQSGDTRTPLKNTNYFVLHGSQDADVTSFMGAKQYERITYDTNDYYFKSGLYIQGANHGQFNTSWGDNDVGTSLIGLLNRKQLLEGEEQREIAKVYLSAFLDTTLKENDAYLPLFADARVGKEWLPETIYLNQFEDTTTQLIANFDEDLDVTTTTVETDITTENLTVWREQEIKMNSGKKGTRGLYLGWHYDTEDDDSVAVEDWLIATYTLQVPFEQFALDSTKTLVVSIAKSTESTDPKSGGKWVENENDSDNNRNEDENRDEDQEEDESDPDSDQEKEEDDEQDDDEPELPLDFTIVVTDSQGEKVSFLLSEFSGVQREIPVILWKSEALFGDSDSENVFQRFAFPIEKWSIKNPKFNVAQLHAIQLRFDQTPQGAIMVDNIGFSTDFKYLKTTNKEALK